MKWKIQILKIVIISFSIFVAISVFSSKSSVCASDQHLINALASIDSIAAVGDGYSADLIIKLSTTATYTSYKTAAPLRLVVDLSQVTPGKLEWPIVINKGNFKSIKANRFDTDAGVITRIEIELNNDSEAVISSTNSGAELKISFPELAAQKQESPTSVVKESDITSIPDTVNSKTLRTLTSILAKNKTITLTTDGPVSEIKSFRLNNPERYVIDLLNVRNGLNSKIYSLNTAGVASARVGVYPDKLRIVFDAVNGSFPEATINKSESGIVITLNDKIADQNINTKLVSTHIGNSTSELADATVKKEVITPKVTNIENKDINIDNKLATSAVVPKQIKLEQEQKVNIQKPKGIKVTSFSTIEMIDFQVLENISRVSIKVDGDIDIDKPVASAGYVTLILKNSDLPKKLQRSLETRSFVSPILRITPVVVKNKKRKDCKIRIAMRMAAPFEFRQEGDMIYVDFKHPEGFSGDKLFVEAVDAKKIANKSVKPSVLPEDEVAFESSIATEQTNKSSTIKGYKGRKVTLEFADAEIRKIFQLLSEVSNKNFVLGDEVTGAISLKLVNVPWDQALDVILDTKGLDKREDGNIILIKGKGKFKSQAEEDLEIKRTAAKSIDLKTETFSVNYADLSAITAQFEKIKTPDRGQISADSRTNKVIVKDTPQALADMKSLLHQLDLPEQQVMIEARIVEATSSFTRTLGVNWGVHRRDGSAAFLGLNSLDSTFGGLTSVSPTVGTASSPGMNMGISFGTLNSNTKLDMRLSAAASAGQVRIVSTPKVATLNNKAAKIEQGDDIPFQTTTKDGQPVTEFKKATLTLNVTPHINANGTIMMKIEAKNDSPGRQFGNNVGIATKTAVTELMIRDGETTVIGGIYVDRDTDTDDGVPYLMDIPFLGNMFKSTSKSKVKSELLIFITPKLLTAIQ